jgi:hypothetical protein
MLIRRPKGRLLRVLFIGLAAERFSFFHFSAFEGLLFVRMVVIKIYFIRLISLEFNYRRKINNVISRQQTSMLEAMAGLVVEEVVELEP